MIDLKVTNLSQLLRRSPATETVDIPGAARTLGVLRFSKVGGEPEPGTPDYRARFGRFEFSVMPTENLREVAQARRVGAALARLHFVPCGAYSRRRWIKSPRAERPEKREWTKTFYTPRDYSTAEPQDIPDSADLYTAHALGYIATPHRYKKGKFVWEEFHRGSYTSYVNEEGNALSLSVILDFDKQDGDAPGATHARAGLVVDYAVRTLRIPRSAILVNATHGGSGVHVRIYTGPQPTWRNYLFGRALLKAVGLKPGNKPGETEHNPKQAWLSEGSYGNLVGLPCSFGMMYFGATNLLHPVTWEKVYGWEETADMLEATIALSEDVYLAAFSALGLDPNTPPEREAARAPRAAQTQVKINGKAVNLTGTEDKVVAEIKKSISLPDYIERVLGRRPLYSTATYSKYNCPGHEPEGGADSFVVYSKNGELLWKCHGDCATGGDVMQLHLLWIRKGITGPHNAGCSYRHAADDLARRIGLDPHEIRNREAAASEVFAKLVSGATKTPETVVAWLKDAHAKIARDFPPEAVEGTLYSVCNAYSYMILTVQKDMAAQGAFMRDEKIAFTLFRGFSGWRSISECLEMVTETRARLHDGDYVAKHYMISSLLGEWSLRKLTAILAERYGRSPGDMDVIFGAGKYFPAKKLHDPNPHGTLQAVVASIQKDSPIREERLVRGGLDRVGKCGTYENRLTRDGKSCGATPIACGHWGCARCAQSQAHAMREILLGGKEEWAHLSWLSKGAVWQTTVTSDNLAEIEDLCDRMAKRAKAPKLRTTGVTEDGKYTMCWTSETEADDGEIRSVIHTWNGDRDHELRDYVRVEQKSVHAAVDKCLRDILSLQWHTDQLLRAGDHEAIKEWVAWKGQHHAVVHTRGSLPWPTRDDIKVHAKSKAKDSAPDYEGQVSVWECAHRQTGYVFARQEDHPFQISQAIRLASVHPGLQAALRAAQLAPPLEEATCSGPGVAPARS